MVSSRSPRHTTFQIRAIWLALSAAILGGFALAGHLAFVIGYTFPLGDGYATYIQVHGYIQLIGWAGLFIIGVSLHFIPRLAGFPLRNPHWLPRILWLIGLGLLLRMVCHSVQPYCESGIAFGVLTWSIVISAFMVWWGVLTYLALLVGVLRQVRRASATKPKLMTVRPFFGMMMVGFLVYTSAHLILLGRMAWAGDVVVDRTWNLWSVEAFTGLTLLPVSFAFSIRLLPLYLGLPTPQWNTRAFAYVFLAAVGLQILGTLPISPTLPRVHAGYVGRALKAALILLLVWRLAVLTGRGRRDRDRTPATAAFGRFDWSIYAAYVWLVVGAGLDLASSASVIAGAGLPVRPDVVRHAYLMGFVTNLIVGVAPRMIPGFIRAGSPAYPSLVGATFWLVNLGAVGRVVYLVVPIAVYRTIPIIGTAASSAFAFSGVLALAGVTCLAVNLVATARGSRPVPPPES